jgi:hypothetical protein
MMTYGPTIQWVCRHHDARSAVWTRGFASHLFLPLVQAVTNTNVGYDSDSKTPRAGRLRRLYIITSLLQVALLNQALLATRSFLSRDVGRSHPHGAAQIRRGRAVFRRLVVGAPRFSPHPAAPPPARRGSNPARIGRIQVVGRGRAEIFAPPRLVAIRPFALSPHRPSLSRL